jgi:hypothetical protein
MEVVYLVGAVGHFRIFFLEKDVTEESVSKEVEEGETIWTLTQLICQRRSGRDRERIKQ